MWKNGLRLEIFWYGRDTNRNCRAKAIGAMAKQDPFYVLKMEIEESVSDSPPRILRPSRARPSYGLIYFVISLRQVHDLKQKMTRYHGLQAKNPERKTLSSQVEAGCQSIRWQVRFLASSFSFQGPG